MIKAVNFKENNTPMYMTKYFKRGYTQSGKITEIIVANQILLSVFWVAVVKFSSKSNYMLITNSICIDF